MCGIAGVISFSSKHRVTREMLAKMSACIAHRGPDGEGLWLNHDGEASPDRPQAGLVHRRLAILDPDPRSNQPFTDGRGRWLIFNGEIYNFRDLRKELESLLPDWAWRTTGDTEVLLASYAAWGEKCVDHLNGMFAFAVWDENAQSLFLARDRMGQKPLYVVHTNHFTAFASELPALRPLAGIDWSISCDGLTEYLQYGAIERFYDTVQPLPPAMFEWVPANRAGHQRVYFQADPREFPGAPVTVTRRLVTQAVERQLVSDVPLGVFLSGGIDSGIVAACARRFGSVLTFSIAFDDPRYDESRHARAVADHLKTEHLEFRVTPNVIDDLPKLAAVLGEPFADSSILPTHYLARETRKHVKVALSGDGGDELFGGYDRYRAMAWANRLRVLRPLSFLGRRLAGGHPKAVLTRVGRLLQSLKGGAGERYEQFARLFDTHTLRQLLPGQEIQSTGSAAAMLAAMRERFPDDVRAALAADRVTYLPNDLLTKVDRASMLHNLEVRSPFMDHELVQFAAGLTTDQLLQGGGKRMLREAFAADLPAWVFKRKKMGFAVPIGEWFRGELRPMLHDHLFAAGSFARQHFNPAVVRRLVDEHDQSRVDHSQRLYALLMLELWWKQQR